MFPHYIPKCNLNSRNVQHPNPNPKDRLVVLSEAEQVEMRLNEERAKAFWNRVKDVIEKERVEVEKERSQHEYNKERLIIIYENTNRKAWRRAKKEAGRRERKETRRRQEKEMRLEGQTGQNAQRNPRRDEQKERTEWANEIISKGLNLLNASAIKKLNQSREAERNGQKRVRFMIELNIIKE